MLRIGLTGGLASGKTFVGRTLASLGCHLLQADELGHRALAAGGPAFAAVVEAFGEQVVSCGEINRGALATIVFNDPAKLALLNGLVHPAVFRMEEDWLQSVAATDPYAIAVIEAAILIETGTYKRYDRIILTVCGRDQQVARSVKRGLTLAEAESRLRQQLPDEEKRKFADYVIDTSGTKEATIEQTKAVYTALRDLKQ